LALIGNPNGRQAHVAARADELTAIRKIQASGIASANGIARALTSRSVPTPAGGKVWALPRRSTSCALPHRDRPCSDVALHKRDKC
jgi:hypothetical protein